MNAMERNPEIPQRLPDLSEEMRKFLAGVRDDEIENLRVIAEMREDERRRMVFMTTEFTLDEMKVLKDNLENLRSIRRFGRFGLWMFGFISAGAGAAAAVKIFFVTGAPK